MNTSDPSQVKYAERASKLLDERRMAALKNVLSTQDGRDVFWWLMGEAGLHQTPWAARNETVFFNIGKQDFARFMLAQICKASPEAYIQMVTDAQKPNEGEKNA